MKKKTLEKKIIELGYKAKWIGSDSIEYIKKDRPNTYGHRVILCRTDTGEYIMKSYGIDNTAIALTFGELSIFNKKAKQLAKTWRLL